VQVLHALVVVEAIEGVQRDPAGGEVDGGDGVVLPEALATCEVFRTTTPSVVTSGL